MTHARNGLTFNPNINITRKKTWQETLEAVVPQLLIADDKSLPYEALEVTAGYLDAIPEVSLADHYCMALTIENDEFSASLAAFINQYFDPTHEKQDNAAPAFLAKIRKDDGKTANVVVIGHAYLPRFLNEICHAVSLYADNQYSLVRHFYRVGPECDLTDPSDGANSAFQAIFNEQHQAYSAAQKMQTRLMSLAHRANGASYAASLFKKVHSSASSEEELHQRLNALIHAYHLGEVGAQMESFGNRLGDKDERTRFVETTPDNLLSIVHRGDMFYEISEAFKKNPDVNLVYVSPDNLFRCGSAALVGNRGSVEESLVRVSNYVLQALAQAALHKDDPQSVLLSLYQHCQPTGNKLRLGAACGVYYLAGQDIPEYVKREDVKAYSEFAYERLHLAREMTAWEGYEDKYPHHKTSPHLVRDVKFLDAQGVVRRVDVMGMVGIDGKPRRSGSVASQVGFDDSDLQDQHGFDDNGRYNPGKTRDFYRDQWFFAFNEIIKVAANRQSETVFILNPVGCGAFDPSKDGSTFTHASAQGFADALEAMSPALSVAKIKLMLPIYDMRKVYPHYKDAIERKYNARIQQSILGGTTESCVRDICEQYHTLKSGKSNIDVMSLSQIVAHALEADGKTRQALLNMQYLKFDEAGQLALGGRSPNAVRDVFNQMQDLENELRVKEKIIAAYKKERGFFYKQSAARTENFDIFTADLARIIQHAIEKNGNTRSALLNLRYVSVSPQSKALVLNAGNAPLVFQEAFNNAVQQAPRPNPQPH